MHVPSHTHTHIRYTHPSHTPSHTHTHTQVEIILSIAALHKGLYTVVAASLLGSILSNLLLVLGE